MKLSPSLLQTIALSVSVTALAATTVSCEKETMKRTDRQNVETIDQENPDRPADVCAACGMG